ncbi:MAG: hypothetical protein HQM09_19935 [Candidatus Riflebacteria bacterium]|nr:hypothetical protein [Candidatus Riflebacteria bacterium]
MNKNYLVLAAASISMVGAFWLTSPATAVTDGNMRRTLEDNHFSENLITSAIYPKSSHDVFHMENRVYIHGLPRVTRPHIYEPDTYTWELAMAAHYKKRSLMVPPANLSPESVQPMPMTQPMMTPSDPGQVRLTPLNPETGAFRPLPPDADAKMDMLLSRAQTAGITPDGQFKADSIKQRLLDHMNSMNSAGVANQPSVPLLPQNLPRGKAGDSYDESYDSGDPQPQPAD